MSRHLNMGKLIRIYRSGAVVEKKLMRQWYFDIVKYADVCKLNHLCRIYFAKFIIIASQ